MRRAEMEIGGEYVIRGSGLGFIRVRLVSFEAQALTGSGWNRKVRVSPRHVTVKVIDHVGSCWPSVYDLGGLRWVRGSLEAGDVVGVATRDIACPWSEDVRREYDVEIARREAEAEKRLAATDAAARLKERMTVLGLTGDAFVRGNEVQMVLTDVAQIERVLALVEADHGGRENGTASSGGAE